MKVVAQKVLASMTMTATVVSLSGFAMLAPVSTALAAVPADYGLREGDTISSDGVATDANYDPDIYIVNDLGYKRLFLNPVIFNFYGHLGGFGNVKKVSPAARDAFPTSGLFRNCEINDQRVWGVEVVGEDTGILHWVNTTGAQAVIDDPNFFRKVFCINNNEFNWYPKGTDYTSVNQVPNYNRPGSGQGTPTPSQGPGGPLNGSAGSLDSADFIGSLNNEEVGEGQNDVPVTGLDLDADNGSDLRLLSVRVSLNETSGGAASEDLDDYADEVTLVFDGRQVGSDDVSDFDEDAGVWSKNITVTGDSIVRMDTTEQLKVAVSALGNLDSVDLLTNQWEVSIESVRYVDAQGAITTENALDDIGTEDRAFSFVDFATAADLELSLNEASDNPDSRVWDIDDNAATDDVVLLTGNLDAEGGDIDVQELTVNIATTGSPFTSIAGSITLEVDGDARQTLQSSECALSSVAVCVFDDIDEAIGEGDSVKIRVLAEINGSDEFTEGSTLLATIDNTDTDAEDENGDQLTGTELTGAANGEAQSFFSEGMQATFVDGSEFTNIDNDATPDVGTFTIEFDVNAFDTDVFVDSSCADDATPPAPPTVPGQGIIFNVTGGGAVTCVVDSDADLVGGASSSFEVLEGSTETFTLTVAVTGAGNFVTVAMESINWATQSLTPANQFYTFDLENFKTTPPRFISL